MAGDEPAGHSPAAKINPRVWPKSGHTPHMTGKWHGLVIDTPDPHGLATFYQELLGFVRVQDDDHWVVIGDSADWPGLAFQLAPDLPVVTSSLAVPFLTSVGQVRAQLIPASA